MIDGKTEVYGIIGRPVSHSLSPAMHNRGFLELGLNKVYVPLPVDDISSCREGLKGLGIRGASVTIPYKQAVMEYLDEIDPLARKIGAVNTIQMISSEHGVKLAGSNTDWQGATRALKEVTELAGKRVIVLGAGGSARAIGFGLLKEGAQVELCSRTQKRGEELASLLDCSWISLDHAEDLRGDILVNATSVGMSPARDVSLVSSKGLQSFDVVMDIVYSPLKTKLLENAEVAGCTTVNGLEMLLFQGVSQFELWTGKTAPVDVMRRALLAETGNKDQEKQQTNK